MLPGEPVFGKPFSAFRLFEGVWMPWCIVRTTILSPGAKMLLAVLLRHCGKKNYCWPKQETLAEELGLSDRTVRNYLQELIDQGLIEIELRGSRNSNNYVSLWHPLYLDEDAWEEKFSTLGRETPSGHRRETPSTQDGFNLISEIESMNTKESSPATESLSDPIEERLTPDVETVQYSDLDEIELPDEGPKSKSRMWTPTEYSKFWNQWRRVTRLKPDARQKQSSKFWLAKFAWSDAITALNGYGGLTAIFEFEDFKKRYWEALKAGITRERAQSEPFVKTSPPAAHTSPVEPDAPWGPAQAILRWNEIVISRPITDWDYRLDSQGPLSKACSEPSFVENFDNLCRRCEAAIIRTDSNWLTFRWLFKQSSGQPVNWWRILKGCLDSIPKERKSQETLSETMAKLVEKNFGKG